MRRYLLFFVMLLCRAGLCQDVGVVMLKGLVQAGPLGHLQAVKVGSRIADGQTVKTGPDALVILNYPDSSRVKLKDNTEVIVHAQPQREPQGVEIVLGSVYAFVTKSAGQKFQVRTPVAVAGVRGTKFFTSFDKVAWMCVEEGQVAMTEGTQSEPVLVGAGFGVVVEKGQAIAPPKQYAWTKKLNWKMDPSEGEVTDHVNVGDGYKEKMLKKDYD